MGKKFWVVAAIGIVLAVAAIVGVVYGVATRPAAQVLRVCWDDTGAAIYTEGSEVEPQACVEPVELRWAPGVRPLGVAVSRARGLPATQGDERAVGAAVRALNAQIGCEVLRRRGGATPISVELGVAAASGDPLADCRHVGRDGLATAATVRVRNAGSEAEAASVVAHELGHALGLAHVEDRSALMRPLQPDETLPGLPTLYLSDDQAAWLRREFCPAQ